VTDGNMPQYGLLDAYTPAKIAERVEAAGVAKANLPLLQLATLGILAGAFIAFGAMWFTVTMTGSTLGFGPGRLLSGIAFSLGLILVIIAGAELFTGNNLIVMAWADGKVSLGRLLRNWAVVYVANFVGSAGAAVLVTLAGSLALADGAVGDTAVKIAQAKVALPFDVAFFRAVLCNALVCLAVWLSMAAHSVSGKAIVIVFPIAAFVALGYEHSIANMYFIPVAMLHGAEGVTFAGLIGNLVPVTLGNIVGGGGFVALVYWIIYGRQDR
jgi:formate/nitrite transporter